MCTVSWIHNGAGYHLFSNRDEKLTRAAALGPRVLERDGLRIVAPLDAAFGGTWIGVNDFGLSVCMLNGNGRACGGRSRGLLALDVLAAGSMEHARKCVRACTLWDYSPFTLLLLDRCEAFAFTWDGRELSALANPRAPLVSSSFDVSGAERVRRAEFERLTAVAGRDAGALERFHASHAGGPSAYSPCMHRSDAETVSLSALYVSDSQAELRYAPAAPCHRPDTVTARLELRC